MGVVELHNYMFNIMVLAVADPGGANPAMAPHRSWQWSLPPLGAEAVMVELWIF